MCAVKFLILTHLIFCFGGCVTLKSEHHITVDHNITIKVEKEVNDFVSDLYGE